MSMVARSLIMFTVACCETSDGVKDTKPQGQGQGLHLQGNGEQD